MFLHTLILKSDALFQTMKIRKHAQLGESSKIQVKKAPSLILQVMILLRMQVICYELLKLKFNLIALRNFTGSLFTTVVATSFEEGCSELSTSTNVCCWSWTRKFNPAKRKSSSEIKSWGSLGCLGKAHLWLLLQDSCGCFFKKYFSCA